jgi:hypothetical protein
MRKAFMVIKTVESGKQISAIMLFILCIALLFCRCSVILFGVGAAYDELKTDSYTVDKSDVFTITKGAPVRVILTNGRMVRGTYRGLIKLGDEEYSQLYRRCMMDSPYGSMMPVTGDTVTFRLHSGKEDVSVFSGFDIGYMLLKSLHEESQEKVPLRVLESIVDKSGETVSCDSIRILAEHGFIPYIRAMEIDVDEEPTLVFLHEVDEAHYSLTSGQRHSGKKTGAIIGLAVDIVYLTVRFFSDEEE